MQFEDQEKRPSLSDIQEEDQERRPSLSDLQNIDYKQRPNLSDLEIEDQDQERRLQVADIEDDMPHLPNKRLEDQGRSPSAADMQETDDNILSLSDKQIRDNERRPSVADLHKEIEANQIEFSNLTEILEQYREERSNLMFYCFVKQGEGDEINEKRKASEKIDVLKDSSLDLVCPRLKCYQKVNEQQNFVCYNKQIKEE